MLHIWLTRTQVPEIDNPDEPEEEFQLFYRRMEDADRKAREALLKRPSARSRKQKAKSSVPDEGEDEDEPEEEEEDQADETEEVEEEEATEGEVHADDDETMDIGSAGGTSTSSAPRTSPHSNG